MKMTKRETIKAIRRIMIGCSGHTHICIVPLYPCFDVQTSTTKYDTEDGIQYHHCCNDITLKEVEKILNEDLRYI